MLNTNLTNPCLYVSYFLYHLHLNLNHLLSLPQNVSFSTKYVANFKAVYNLHFWMEGSIFSPPNSNFCGCCFCFRVIGNDELLATITTILNFQFFIMIKCSYLSMTLWAENSLKDILNYTLPPNSINWTRSQFHTRFCEIIKARARSALMTLSRHGVVSCEP